jgi:hypothetical protein
MSKQKFWAPLFILIAIVLFSVAVPLTLAAQTATDAPATTATVPLAAKIVALAATISGFIGMIKTVVPGLSGRFAVAINIVASILGMIVAAGPDKVLTIPFLASVIVAVLGAMGFHDLSNFLRGKNGG